MITFDLSYRKLPSEHSFTAVKADNHVWDEFSDFGVSFDGLSDLGVSFDGLSDLGKSFEFLEVLVEVEVLRSARH